MICFPDASFLISLYFDRPCSERATAFVRERNAPLDVSDLLVFEMENGLRAAAHQNAADRRRGLRREAVESALADLALDLESGVLSIVAVDLTAVVRIGRLLSQTHTWRGGHRPMDILQVATAKWFGADQFLTFDQNQAKLAVAEGMVVLPV